MKRLITSALLIFCSSLVALAGIAIGRITDASTEKGIPGVRVSDGYGWTVTDTDGRYSIEVDKLARVVYYSLPSGYTCNLAEGGGHPVFYAPLTHKRREKHDFVLKPLPSPEKDFHLVMVADPQAKNERQVERFETETIPDMDSYLPEHSYVFGLGDVVSDSDPSWDLMLSAVSSLKHPDGRPIPFYNAIGNHDHMNYDKTPWHAQERWVRDYGPTDFTLDRGDVHIIVMENCFNIAPKKNNSVNGVTWRHEGGFSDAQMKWLREDIQAVPDKEHRMVVLCCHIPFLDGSGKSTVVKARHYAEVLTLLSGFGEAHIMTGHKHKTVNYVHRDYPCRSGLPVYEHVHASPFGYFWFGKTCSDGTPASYTVYDVRGAHMDSWRVKSVGYEESYQMRVYDGNRLPGWEEPLKGCMIVDLWGGDEDNWTVELYSKDGRKLGDFIHCLTDVVNQECFGAACSAVGTKRSWPSTDVWARTLGREGHLWYFRPEGMLPSEMTDWEVRASQRIPGGDRLNVYTCSSYTVDFKWFK